MKGELSWMLQIMKIRFESLERRRLTEHFAVLSGKCFATGFFIVDFLTRFLFTAPLWL